MKNFLQKLFLKLGTGGIVILALTIVIYSYVLVKKLTLSKNPVYTKGLIIGFKKHSRGTIYLHYRFSIDDKQFEGSTTTTFCNGCDSCCHTGDSVLVKYQKGNPNRTGLDTIHKMPCSVTTDQNKSLTQKVDNIHFWNLKTEQREDAGDDGSEWIIEAIKNNKYHIVTRWSPSAERQGNFRRVGEYLISLSKISSKETKYFY